MSDYLRYKVAGWTFFFTLVAHSRARLFDDNLARTLAGWPNQVGSAVRTGSSGKGVAKAASELQTSQMQQRDRAAMTGP